MDPTDLTLQEKASLCLGGDFWHTAGVPRLGIPALSLSDGPHGLRNQPGAEVGVSGSLPATCFPTASALGSSFDPELVRQVGRAVGQEARDLGVDVVLGPGVNIKRSPLCGRNFEYLSEDPLVSGALGAALVEGIQSQGVGACVKHFAANNQETDRLRISADVDERTLREIYLPAFEHIITRAHPWTVMCAYNRVNGVYASQHHWLLTEILREEWGFDGLVMSDWGAVHDRVAALRAGLDLEMPPDLGVSDAALVAAVTEGRLDESVLDRTVDRLLRLIGRVSAETPPAAEPVVRDVDAHHRLARVVAADCAVLLKNDGDLLPLSLAAGQTIAVIGEFARTPRFQGAGSSQVSPTRVDTALAELRNTVPDGVDIAFAPGFTLTTNHEDRPIRDDGSAGEDLAAEALELAGRADVVLLFLGLPAAAESEGFDRTHLRLPDDQLDLVHRLAQANPRLVVVLANGSVVQLAGWSETVPAVLECWLGGQAAGGAVADLLLGAVGPSGRLAETIPVRLEDTPSFLTFPGEEGHVRYGEGVFVGYRGYDRLDLPVAYPFGHGLTYTTFEYSRLSARITAGPDGDTRSVHVSCDITNTGTRPGKEVVQLYVHGPDGPVARPSRELKGFTKVALSAGGTTTATFELSARDLSYWSPRHRRWVLAAGPTGVSIGASSRDLRLSTTLDVVARPVAAPVDDTATLREWLADPEAGPALRREVGTTEDGTPRGILGDDELLTVIGDFPLRTLAAMGGLGISHAMVDTLLARRPASSSVER